MIPYHLHIQAGTTFELEFVYTNQNRSIVDLEGFDARFQVRNSASAEGIALEVFPTIDVATSTVTLNLDFEQTSGLVTGQVYAIELTNGATVIRLSEGQLVVSPEVVR